MPKFSCNISTLFGELGFLDRFAAAAAAGFRAVEFHEPYAHEIARLADLLGRHRLELVLFNLPMGRDDEAGIACLPDRANEFADGLGRAIEYAKALGCAQVNCLAGIAPAAASRGVLVDTLLRNLEFAAGQFGRAGLRLTVEPLNARDVPGFLLTRSNEVAALLETLGAPNLFLQYDVYHAQIMEGDLAATIERLLSRIGRFLFERLDALGYRGWVGAEYRPSRATLETLEWFAPFREG
jgi:hydroxypyruvate isomerase